MGWGVRPSPLILLVRGGDLMKLGDQVSISTLDAIKAKIAMAAKVEVADKAAEVKRKKKAVIRKKADDKRYRDKGKHIQAKIKANDKAARMTKDQLEARLSGVLRRMRANNASEVALEAATNRIKARRAKHFDF